MDHLQPHTQRGCPCSIQEKGPVPYHLAPRAADSVVRLEVLGQGIPEPFAVEEAVAAQDAQLSG